MEGTFTEDKRAIYFPTKSDKWIIDNVTVNAVISAFLQTRPFLPNPQTKFYISGKFKKSSRSQLRKIQRHTSNFRYINSAKLLGRAIFRNISDTPNLVFQYISKEKDWKFWNTIQCWFFFQTFWVSAQNLFSSFVAAIKFFSKLRKVSEHQNSIILSLSGKNLALPTNFELWTIRIFFQKFHRI